MDIVRPDTIVAGRIRPIVDALRERFRMKDDEIQALSNDLEIASRENGDLRRKLASREVIIEAQDAIIDAQMKAITERDEMIDLMRGQLRSLRG